MFRPFVGSSLGPPETQSKKLSLLHLHYGIPHAYRIRYKIVNCAIAQFTISLVDLRVHLGTSSSYTYHHSHQWGNVAAPHGRPNLRRRLHYRHNQEGKSTKFIRTGGDIGDKKKNI